MKSFVVKKGAYLKPFPLINKLTDAREVADLNIPISLVGCRVVVKILKGRCVEVRGYWSW